jgi:hypothetical protein
MSKELNTPQWLPLLNYSTKYGISLSTLRRRIKASSIHFKLEAGKYLILEDSPKNLGQPETKKEQVSAPALNQPVRPVISSSAHHDSVSLNSSSFVEASVLSSANRLVEEIKSAYARILQEKEEQIAQFKEEVADLRMLVRILEEGSAKQKTSAEFMGAPQKFEPREPVQNYSSTEGTSKESFSDDAFGGDIYFGDFQNREI